MCRICMQKDIPIGNISIESERLERTYEYRPLLEMRALCNVSWSRPTRRGSKSRKGSYTAQEYPTKTLM